MINLTDPKDIAALKEAFGYSFKGPLGQRTLEFLESYCGFWLGGARENLDQLQYEAGKRDVILTMKTIMRPEWTPEQIADQFKRMERG